MGDQFRAMLECPGGDAEPDSGGGEAPATDPYAMIRGLQVDSVGTVTEGLERIREGLLQSWPYALVVWDLDVAGCDPGSTVGRFWEMDAGLSVLGCASGECADSGQVRCESAFGGQFLWVRKPLVSGQVRLVVALEVRRRLLWGELQQSRQALESIRRSLQQSREEADAARRAKDEFMANIGHELRTPMNAVLGFTGLLMKEPLSPKQMEKLLDFSQLSAGKLELEAVPFHLDALLRETLDAVLPAAREKGLAILCHTEEVVPHWLEGDRARLGQVLVSLLGNAVKFTPQGTIHVRTILDEETGSSVVLRVVVTDTGIGVPPDQQARILETFAQGDGSLTRQFGGMGLGLSLAKHMVDLMGGQLGFHSTLQEGSSFWVTLPLKKHSPAQGDRASSPASRTPEEPAMEVPTSPVIAPQERPEAVSALSADEHGKRRVLVADDDRLARTLMEVLLTRAGCFVDPVGGAREALRVLQCNRYDLVILDKGAPDTDGLEAVRWIRSQEAGGKLHQKIICLGADLSPEDRRACLAAGADDFVSKPISAEALLEAIDRQLPGLIASAEDASQPPGFVAEEPSQRPSLLARTLQALDEALRRFDFVELENHAQTIRDLAARAGSEAVADHAMRVQLAVRRGDLECAATAIHRLNHAVHGGLPLRSDRGSPCHSRC